MENGIISEWKDEKGFGYISPESGGKSIFFHITDYSNRHKRPQKNLKVQYISSKDRSGRSRAVDIVPLKGHINNGREVRQKIFSLVFFSSFSVGLYFLFESNFIPIEIVYLYVIMSVVTFLMYVKDKNAAQWGEWRTSERTLHGLSMIGGWPGAKIAQSFLRHKSKKMSFRIIYWITVGVNCGALYWLTTAKGSIWLNSVLKVLDFG
ncbi:MAG: cold shock and DUF1294 domain-containing protein [Desulfobulbaceae bacterium]|nr:cold shock and DUF1294 domain-containing protein [Desulfobulbaceae bacterium]